MLSRLSAKFGRPRDALDSSISTDGNGDRNRDNRGSTADRDGPVGSAGAETAEEVEDLTPWTAPLRIPGPLLEHVLAFLPLAELCPRCQLVCRAWRDCIAVPLEDPRGAPGQLLLRFSYASRIFLLPQFRPWQPDDEAGHYRALAMVNSRRQEGHFARKHGEHLNALRSFSLALAASRGLLPLSPGKTGPRKTLFDFHPDVIGLLSDRAACLQELHRVDEAVVDLSQVLELCRREEEEEEAAAVVVEKAERSSGKTGQETSNSSAASARQRLRAIALTNRGELFALRGDWGRAIGDQTSSLAVAAMGGGGGELFEARFNRANARRRAPVPHRNLDGAIEDYKACLELEPLQRFHALNSRDLVAEALYGLGVCQAEALPPEEQGETVESFTRALELTKRDTWCLYFRGKAFEALGQIREAVSDWNMVASIVMSTNDEQDDAQARRQTRLLTAGIAHVGEPRSAIAETLMARATALVRHKQLAAALKDLAGAETELLRQGRQDDDLFRQCKQLQALVTTPPPAAKP